MFSTGLRTLRIDGYLTVKLLTHGNLAAFHRLMKYGEPLSVKGPPKSGDLPYMCAAGLQTLLVEYLLMQNRHLTGEERNPKNIEDMREVN